MTEREEDLITAKLRIARIYAEAHLTAVKNLEQERKQKMDWLTNNPDAAEALRRTDAEWEAAHKAAENLPLAEKIIAYRNAKDARREAYDAVHMKRP